MTGAPMTRHQCSERKEPRVVMRVHRSSSFCDLPDLRADKSQQTDRVRGLWISPVVVVVSKTLVLRVR